MRSKEPHTLAGAYAMDALGKQDQARFERHLVSCEACAQEVAELRETTARLGAATAVVPPPAMKARVLAEAAQTRQHVPADVVAAPATRRRALRLAIPAVAAGLIAVATIFGLANSDANQQLDQARQRSEAIAAVLTARDATMMTGKVAGGGSATVVMSHAMDALVFTAAGLPAVSGYQLWLVGPSGDRLAGPVSVSGQGMADPMIATGLRPGDRLVLTAAARHVMLRLPL